MVSPILLPTKSGNPLSDDFGGMIVENMRQKGIKATQKYVPHTLSPDTIKEQIVLNGEGQYAYYIKMLEWKTEAHFRGALHYNLEMAVLDAQGSEVKSAKEDGFFFFNEENPGKKDLATATAAILERLFR